MLAAMSTPGSLATESPPRADAPAVTSRPALARTRIEVIDVLRGLIMVIMLLDHVRETFYRHVPVPDPMDVASTQPLLFFTRTLAHFCAPLFVFLTGLGAWLYANPTSGPRSATGFLVKRGLLLVFLEVTVISFVWTGEFPPPVIWLQVIWAIGICMIFLGLVHSLPRWVLATVALALIFGHNAFSSVHLAPGEAGYIPWTILHDRGFIAAGPPKLRVSYPLVPWLGVIVLGWLAGPLFARTMDLARRARILTRVGLACLGLLAVLRGFNIYGETLPWTVQPDFLHTLMSFINFTKYPPSLDFLLFTLGVGFLLLPRLERVGNGLTHALAVIGSAPMFFYVFHLYVLLTLQLLLVAALGANHGDRFGLGAYWPVWPISLAMIVALYFPTRAFARYKRTSRQAWVRYF
jgi:uncharacterized membrane protein